MSDEKCMNTPVLFLIFNRAHLASRVFNAIRKAQPPKLYVMADGPRPGIEDDIKKCEKTREIIKKVDWECEVRTLFFSENRGCGRAVVEGINWFFENVEQGIILEDDCLPNESFFQFCEDVLDHYKHEPRVMHINGNNFNISKFSAGEASYHFGSYPQAWGWGTWKRAWENFDFDIKNWPDIKKNILKNMNWNWYERIIQTRKFDDLYDSRRTDVWDYQWHLKVFQLSGLAIVPKVNLISNIGFGHDATHTFNYRESCTELETETIRFPLVHPKKIVPDECVNTVYRRIMIGNPSTLLRMIKKRMRDIATRIYWIISLRNIR